MNTVKLARPAAFLVAALIGLGAGACKHSELRIETVCKRHCSRVVDCNDNLDYDNCVSDCIDTSDDCASENDVEAALDKLDLCPDQACNELLGCGTEAWIECKL
jgi:hypothetical protein